MYILLFICLILLYCYCKNKVLESFNNTKPKVVVVVPCIPKHLDHLPGLFKSINQQTLHPVKVIVTLSETNNYDCKRFEMMYRPHLESYIELKFNCIDCKNNSAENRNRAISNYEGIDFISYIDADDEMCPNRLKRMTDLMIQHNADMGLHSFDDGVNQRCETGNRVILAPEMRKIEKKNNKTLHISSIQVHHGHSMIKPKVIQNVKQDPKFGYGEDSKFVREVIRKGYDVVYTDDKLSHYYFKRSATFGK